MKPQLKLSPYQKSKLRLLLAHVLKTNQFYKKKYSNIKKRDINIHFINLFTQLPLLSKKELIQDQEKFPLFGKNNDKTNADYYIQATSGTSTGRPLLMPISKRDYIQYCELNKYSLIACGVNKKDIVFISTAPNLYAHFIESVSQIGATPIPADLYSSLQTLQTISYSKATTIITSPTVLSSLITIIKQNSVNLSLLSSLKKVIVSGENITIKTVNYFEKSLSVKCIPRFGLSELGNIAVGCKSSKNKVLYHHMPKSSVLEVLSLTSGKYANEGEMILTNLWRKNYPFIKYRTGNKIKLIHKKCQCGLEGQKFEYLGRCDNTIRFYTKYIYPDECELILQNNKDIVDYQIELAEKNGIETIIIKIKTDLENNKNLLLSIMEEFEKRFGLHPKIISVSEIDRSRSQWKSKRFIDLRPVLYPLLSVQKKKNSVLYAFINKFKSQSIHLFGKFIIKTIHS
jgi:phenylacetate-CoA ligase